MNHRRDIVMKPALIQYLEKIELDPEVEYFGIVHEETWNSNNPNVFQETDSLWPRIIPECDVCEFETTRYPACNRAVNEKSSAASVKKLCGRKRTKRKIELKEYTKQMANDVTTGAEKIGKRITANQSLFLSVNEVRENRVMNFKSDFGIGRSTEYRKGNIIHREREGCCSDLSYVVRNDCPLRKEFKQVETDETSMMVNFAETEKGVCDRNLNQDINSNDLSSMKEGCWEGISSKMEVVNLGKDVLNDAEGIITDEEGMKHQVIDGNNLATRCESGSDDMNFIAMETSGIGICRQSKDLRNSKILWRDARQNTINGVNPSKSVPQIWEGEGILERVNIEAEDERNQGVTEFIEKQTKPAESISGNRCEGFGSKKTSDSEATRETKHLHCIDGINLVPETEELVRIGHGGELINDETVDCYYEINDQCAFSCCGKHLTQDGCCTLASKESCSAAEGRVAISKEERAAFGVEMVNEGKVSNFRAASGRSQQKESAGRDSNCMTVGCALKAAINSAKSNTADFNGHRIENAGHKSSDTKHCSEAKQKAFVEICIDGSEEEGTSDSEGKHKWMIEIVDQEETQENIGLSFLGNSAGDCEKENPEGGEGFCIEPHDKCSKPSKQYRSSTRDQKDKTIKLSSDHNLLSENKRLACESIVRSCSQKCIVNKDLQESEKTVSGQGSVGREMAMNGVPSEKPEKRKIISKGQGVQLRLNVKQPLPEPADQCENSNKKGKQSKTNIENDGQSRKVVSRATAVTLKSTVKEENKERDREGDIEDKKECDVIEESDKQECDVDISGEAEEFRGLDDALFEILNYEPPKLAVPVIGKGRVEFDLKKQGHSSEESLKMENARLSKILLEVDSARANTVKALLRANTVLHKVQGDNTELEGNLKTLNTEKKYLEKELRECKEKLNDPESVRDIFANSKATEFESSMKVIINSWKKEKQELLAALAKSSMRVKRVESDAEGLRLGFSRVKNQLESSNATFSKLLEHNLQATTKIEEELLSLRSEKEILVESLNESSGATDKVTQLENEITLVKNNLELTNEEKEELIKKIEHLDRKNKQCGEECEELQEQLDHSQEILDKLAEKEEELKERLEREIGEKEYLQGCLDETGQILLHLRNNEKKLKDEKDELEEDLEEEMQVNESLQQSLKSTIQEHQSLVNRLEDMTKVHITVKESLDAASKKERTYQQQIANLNKTSNILHYTLEKEREEKMDLQEMYDNLESQWKTFKHEKMIENLDVNKKLDEVLESEAELRLQNEKMSKELESLREHLEQEEEDNDDLRKKVARLESWKLTNETELAFLRKQRDDNESEAEDLKKRVDDLKRGLTNEKEKYENLMCTLEDTEESLDKVSKEASLAQNSITKQGKELEELKAQLREKTRKIHELEIQKDEETGEKDRMVNRCKNLELEIKEARRFNVEQNEELESSQMHIKRIEREKAIAKRALEDTKREFENHKERCVENFQKLREELVGVQNQLVEKDRQAMKQKENWQDAIENTAADLQLLRDFLGGEMKPNGETQGPGKGGEKTDINLLRKAYHRAESELLEDVTHLEGMLKTTKDDKNTVAIVRSPMSKIKLSEIKQLRDEMYELKSELTSVQGKLGSVLDEVVALKIGEKRREFDDDMVRVKAKEIEVELTKLDETIKKIESGHKYVIERNNGIINTGIVSVSRENSLDEMDSSGESAYEAEDKDLLRKEIIDSKLLAENENLKQEIELLRRRTEVGDVVAVDRTDSRPSSRKGVNSSTKVADDAVSKTASKTAAYMPPTSMRYPPRYGGASRRRETELTSGYDSNGDRSASDVALKSNTGQRKGPSYFATEMSMFHTNDSAAANILRRKLNDKLSLRESKSDTASVRSSDSYRGVSLGRSQRSGSLDDDDNDEDSDVPIGEFRRSRTLPKKFKSKSAWTRKF